MEQELPGSWSFFKTEIRNCFNNQNNLSLQSTEQRHFKKQSETLEPFWSSFEISEEAVWGVSKMNYAFILTVTNVFISTYVISQNHEHAEQRLAL